MRQRKQVKTDHAVSTAHVGLADQKKNELTHSSAFNELPAWVGINTRPQTAKCGQKVSNLEMV